MYDEYIDLADFEVAAERLLPRHLADYIAGGSGEERVTARNREAFDALTLRPRFLRGVSARTLSTTVQGAELAFPLALAPAAFQGEVHPEGEAATARGAGMAGALTIVPGGSGRYEQVAETATGPLWLQFYHRDRETTATLVERAQAAGYRALCPTIDVPVQNAKRRDRRNWFLPPYRAVQYARHHEPFPDIWQPGFPFTLDDLEWLRGVASVPIVVKGVMTAEDARAAVDAGADGIFVSNHGGRILDATLSTIETLPEVLAEVGDEVEVYLDGGIRRGTDVLKALALGARAVAVGRPWFWGLAVGGADGVHRVLRILREELDAALALCGQSSVLDLDDALLNVPREWGR